MAATKSRGKAAGERLKLKVADLYARSNTAPEIAVATGLSEAGVRYWIGKIRKDIARRIADMDAERAAQLESNRRLRTEAWQAWERSAQPEETTIAEKTSGDSKGEGTKTQLRRVGQTGDAAYLAVVDKANKADRDLLGLNAPTKHTLDASLGGIAGAPPVKIEATNAGDPIEFAARVAAILVDAGILPAGLPIGNDAAVEQVGEAKPDAEASGVPARSAP